MDDWCDGDEGWTGVDWSVFVVAVVGVDADAESLAEVDSSASC